MKNITQSGYETITVIRSQYDPVIGQCLTISPVLWIKESKDKNIEDQKYLVFARNGCIRDIFDIRDPIPIELLTECGYVKADENGQIKVEGRCGIKTASDDCQEFCFNLLTGYGLKGGGQICNGETRTIELDAEITGDVKGPDSAKVGDVPVFKDETGKSITTSNINSVDGLTKITKSTKGEQKLLVETLNDEAGSDAAVEAKCTGIGYPYLQMTSDNTKWRDTVNPVTKNRTIFPIIDGTSKDPILTMLPNGVMLMPWQPKAGGYLRTTPEFPTVTDFEIGSNLPFVKVLDEEGYNTAANNFFIGGSGQGASYTTTYEGGLYLVLFQFNVDKGNTGNPEQTALFTTKVKYGNRIYSFRTPLPVGRSFSTVSGTVILRGIKGQKISWSTAASNGTPKIAAFGPENEIDNYVGVYMLG